MFRMQVKVKEGETMVWKDVKATHMRTPYEYKTRDEANRMLWICYPLTTRDEARVVEV